MPEPRIITDAPALRALGHPVRLTLLDALRGGPLTATQAGERIGETSTTCSFHLRQLAKYGFVEEAGGGRGRSRPWRLVAEGWSAPAQPGNPEFTAATRATDHVLLDRLTSRLSHFIDHVGDYPDEWQHAASASSDVVHLTAAELTEFAAAYRALVETYRNRPEKTGTRQVDVFFAASPSARDPEAPA